LKAITLLNEKGGVGKTTLATHLAAGLTLRDLRVLVIDTDPQAHATTTFGLKKEPALHDLLVREAEWTDVLRIVPGARYCLPDQPMPSHPLLVLPNNVETRAIPQLVSDVDLLKERMEDLEDMVDVVIFDTPPTPSLMHSMIYMATDGILYPTQCETLSFGGLADSLLHRKQISSTRHRSGKDDILVAGIVPTMYRASTLAHKHNLSQLQAEFGDLVWDAIPQRTAWAEASTVGQLVYNFEPLGAAAADAWKLVDRVMGVVETWQTAVTPS
jgi:chromosome partitioning protein